MSVHLLYLLLGLSVLAGWPVAHHIGYWRADRQCCTCCTCDDCQPRPSWRWEDDEGNVRQGYGGEHPIAPARHLMVLEPGPTIYPELAKLAAEDVSRPDDAPPGDTGPGHTTSTWLMERRLWMDAHYPIPAGA